MSGYGDHPTSSQIMAFAEKRCGIAYEEWINEHLASCVSCQPLWDKVRVSVHHRSQAYAQLAREAVAVCRQLADIDPRQFRPALARSLAELGLRLCELGHPANARPAVEEAVAIYRQLAASNPRRFRPDLAWSLEHLRETLLQLRLPADAVPAGEEAVAIYRQLAASNPRRFRPGLARSLTALGNTAHSIGRLTDALPAEEEAAAIYRQVVAASRWRPRPDPPSLLGSYRLFYVLGHMTGKEDEAILIRRQMTAGYPDRYRAHLAWSLESWASTLAELDRRSDALPLQQEAVAIYQKLAHRDTLPYELYKRMTYRGRHYSRNPGVQNYGRNYRNDLTRSEDQLRKMQTG
jgi:hypothetical protein